MPLLSEQYLPVSRALSLYIFCLNITVCCYTKCIVTCLSHCHSPPFSPRHYDDRGLCLFFSVMHHPEHPFSAWHVCSRHFMTICWMNGISAGRHIRNLLESHFCLFLCEELKAQRSYVWFVSGFVWVRLCKLMLLLEKLLKIKLLIIF